MTVSSTNGVEKLDSNMQNNETGPLYYVIHKNKIKMDQRPKWETRIHKILEENTGSNFFDTVCGKYLLDTSPEARETKARMNYWDFIKITSLYTVKETINKIKRYPTEWEKIFVNNLSVNDISGKVFKIY